MDTGVELESVEKGSECNWGPQKIAEVARWNPHPFSLQHLKNQKFPKFSTNFSLFSALSDKYKFQLARTLDSFGVQLSSNCSGMLNF